MDRPGHTPRWYHWLGLATAVGLSATLAVISLIAGHEAYPVPGQAVADRALGLLMLPVAPLLAFRRLSGFRLGAVAFLSFGLASAAFITAAYVIHGENQPTPFQWFGIALVVGVFSLVAAMTWRLQRVFVAR